MSFLFMNWKAIAVGLVIAVIFYGGWHVKGAMDKAEADKLLYEQAQENKKAQDAADAKSVKLEADLADARKETSDAQKQWRKINAKPHTVCDLPDGAIGMLKDDTTDDKNPG